VDCWTDSVADWDKGVTPLVGVSRHRSDAYDGDDDVRKSDDNLTMIGPGCPR
jgi:hypothetical protein